MYKNEWYFLTIGRMGKSNSFEDSGAFWYETVSTDSRGGQSTRSEENEKGNKNN